MLHLPDHTSLLARAALACALAGAVGCAPEPTPSPLARVDLQQPTAAPLRVEGVPLPLAEPGPEPSPEFANIIEEVEQQGAAMFQPMPPAEVLHQLEIVYFTTGHIFDLADHYRDAVDADGGPGAELAPRLAYLYQRLGQDALAERWARDTTEARPDDPAAWFVFGYVLGQQEAPTEATLDVILQSFRRVLELDPDFSLPGGITARSIREQVNALNARAAASAQPPAVGAETLTNSAPTDQIPSDTPTSAQTDAQTGADGDTATEEPTSNE